MKELLISFFIICILSPSLNSQSNFLNFYKKQSQDLSRTLLSQPIISNNNIFLLEKETGPTGIEILSSHLYKLDLNGIAIDSTSIIVDNFSANALILKDSLIIVFGSTVDFSKIATMTFDLELNLLRHVDYINESSNSILSLQLSHKNNLIVAYGRLGFSSGYCQQFDVVNNNQIVKKGKILEIGRGSETDVNDVEINDKEGVKLLYSSFNRSIPGRTTLLNIDSLNTITRTRNFTHRGDAFGKFSPSGEIYLFGDGAIGAPIFIQQNFTYIYRLDGFSFDSLQFLTQVPGYIPDSRDYELAHFKFLKNGDFILTGNTWDRTLMDVEDCGTSRHAWMARFKADGTPLWERVYYFTENERPHLITGTCYESYGGLLSEAPNGDLILQGSRNALIPTPRGLHVDAEGFLLRTDANGCRDGFLCEAANNLTPGARTRPSIFSPGLAWNEFRYELNLGGPPGGRTYRYQFDRDSVYLDGEVYYPLQRSERPPGDGGFTAIKIHLREKFDKVYVYNEFCREEQVLYDFTAEVGDTLSYPTLLNYPEGSGGGNCPREDAVRLERQIMRVAAIDSFTLDNGEKRKRWKMEVRNPNSFTDWSATFDVIEGFGSTLGLLMPGYASLYVGEGTSQRLYCFSRLGEPLYARPVFFGEDTVCYRPIRTSTHDAPRRNVTQLKLFPNPTNDRFQLDGFRATELRIYDLAGKQVRYYGREDGYSTTGLLPGMYLVRALDDEGSIAAAKLLVQ